MTRPVDLKPMRHFDPSNPAIVHDAITDELVNWDWEWAEELHENAIVDPMGRVLWRGMLFDGWTEVLGG